MRNSISLLAVVLGLALLTPGCAGPEQKMGRGFRNLTEFARMGEIRRSMEQTALWDGPDVGYTTGAVKGFSRSLARTFVGAYEVVTFPIPSYEPIATNCLSANPVYPESYKPWLLADPTFGPDANLGFAGGDVAPFIAGSRFFIYDY
jgi:putative exosortase-associated protein (TIGR04073 family)